MIDTVEIVDVNYGNVDTCGYCGANPLGHQRKREWIRQCLLHGLPYVVPLNYGYTEGKILFHGALTGKKLDCLKEIHRFVSRWHGNRVRLFATHKGRFAT